MGAAALGLLKRRRATGIRTAHKRRSVFMPQSGVLAVGVMSVATLLARRPPCGLLTHGLPVARFQHQPLAMR